MMSMLSAAADSMQGQLLGSDRMFDGVSTDTRTLREGELFVALAGPNFDGGDYVSQAKEKGAAAAVVGSQVEGDLAQITVADTKLALGQLGAAWRRDKSAVVIGITGSNGKTTLKELTAACLSQAAPTIATEGNLNNDIGMPLMLTRIDETAILAEARAAYEELRPAIDAAEAAMSEMCAAYKKIYHRCLGHEIAPDTHPARFP